MCHIGGWSCSFCHWDSETLVRFNHHDNQGGLCKRGLVVFSPASCRDLETAPLPQSYQHCDHNAQSGGALLSWNLSSERNAGMDKDLLSLCASHHSLASQYIRQARHPGRVLVGLSSHPTSFPHKAMAHMETNTSQVHPLLGWSWKSLSFGAKAEQSD